MESFFSDVDTPKLSKNQAKLCEEDLIEKDLYNSLKSMQNGKSPGNDRFTKKVVKHFGTNRKKSLSILYEKLK